MEEILIQLIFGLPAIIIALLFSLAGLVTKKSLLLVIGGLFSIGPAYYLGGGLHIPVFIVPLLLFATAFAVYKKKTRWVWIMLIPLGLAALYMAFLYIYVFLKNSGVTGYGNALNHFVLSQTETQTAKKLLSQLAL